MWTPTPDPHSSTPSHPRRPMAASLSRPCCCDHCHTFSRLAKRRQSNPDSLLIGLTPLVRARVRQTLRRHRLMTSAERCADMVQEVWLALIEGDCRLLRTFDPARSLCFAPYLSMLVRREVGNRVQKARAQKRGGQVLFVPMEDVGCAGQNPEIQTQARQLADDLSEHLSRTIPRRGLDVLTLLCGRGYSASEVAQQLRVKTQVVYNWQFKIRAATRAFLADHEPSAVSISPQFEKRF